MISIFEACKHRPTALEDARALTQTVIAALLGIAQQGIVDRTAIIATAHAVLERFDTTAAAVYRAYHKDM